jgi:tRNA G10  N-methylase Trm11
MIKERIKDFSWDFLSANTKEYTHGYHLYPAMMIPQIARKLIETYKESEIELLFDPYCGSGTSLVEAKLQGINSVGTDLNPLARLISKVKNSFYDTTKLREAKNYLLNKLYYDYNNQIELENENFNNIEYWFSKDVLKKLGYIKQLIYTELDKSIFDFFLVPFSETVREASYTRNGEFKLFRIAPHKIENFRIDPFELFIRKVERNFKGYLEFENKANSKVFSKVCDFDTCEGIPNKILQDKSVDLVVTSPPYGDSFTTVAYGSFSKLSNQWLGVENASKIDKILMGGQKKEINGIASEVAQLELIRIQAQDEKRFEEVNLFLHDYKLSIENVSKVVKKGGVVCYVVGNRTVKGIQIPLDYITVEFFENNGFYHLDTFVRNIPNKRMPSRNSPTNQSGQISSTMTNEYIVILRKENF